MDAFVLAQDQGAVGRVQRKAHYVAHLVDEEWVAAELEGHGEMKREREGAPVRLIVDWLSPVALAMARVDQCVAASGWLSSVRVSTFPTCRSLSLRGVPGRGSSSSPSRPPSNGLGVAQTVGGQQHDPGAHRQSLRSLGSTRPRVQLFALLRAG
jgi:hypothetical protein